MVDGVTPGVIGSEVIRLVHAVVSADCWTEKVTVAPVVAADWAVTRTRAARPERGVPGLVSKSKEGPFVLADTVVDV